MAALPNRDRRSERREATRREILDSAWAIARRDGLAAITLREVAATMGMRAPSLYSHVASKNAIYDAMFEESWTGWSAALSAADLPGSPRAALLAGARLFLDFAVDDPARYQLMNQRTVPGFTPSDHAYQASRAAYRELRTALGAQGVAAQRDIDLWSAMITGFADQQLANDPGGSRWRRQLPRLVDMYCDEVGIAGPRLRRAS